MKKNKKILIKAIILIAIITMNLMILQFYNVKLENNPCIEFQLSSNQNGDYQFFYAEGDNEFLEENSYNSIYNNKDKVLKVSYIIPRNTSKIRFDIGTCPTRALISNVQISYMHKKVDITEWLLREDNFKNTLEISSQNGKDIYLNSLSDDGYIIVNLNEFDFNSLYTIDNAINILIKVLLCVILNFGIAFAIKTHKALKTLIMEIYQNRVMIWNLSKSDFKTKYAGSYLGIFWAFVQPVITVLIYWFVFQVGFRTPSVEDVPFILWLVAGLVPWFFFSDAIVNATNAMTEYSYLVKKVVFKISILPIVKIISVLFIHIFFVAFAIIVAMIYGYMPTWYTLQVIYYSVCMFVMVLGITYATSAIIIFFKDLNQIIGILLQIGIWMTPIMWNYNIISEKYQWIFKLNPMYYIVEGYRDSLINHVWFWERYNQTIYFWIIALALLGVGALIFKRLKIHFADVL